MTFFGSTIKETKQAFLGSSASKRPVSGKKDPEIEKKEAIARIIFTGLLIVGAFVLILTKNAPDIGKYVLGIVSGYWLK